MSRRRRRSTARELSKPTASTLDWSTSYMASASSSHSTHTLGAVEDSSTCEESADDLVVVHRDDYIPPLGPLVNLTKEASPAATSTRSTSPLASRKITTQTETNVGSVTTANSNAHATHTRSPSVIRHSHLSHRHRMYSNLLPKYFSVLSSIPRLSAHVDTRKFIEHLILFAGAITTLYKFTLLQNVVSEYWLLRELGALIFVTAIYLISTRMRHNIHQVPSHLEQGHRRHASPVSQKDSSPNYSLLWMTSSKDYRSDADDGVLTALLLGPIVAASMLYGTITVDVVQDSYYPPGWIIESPLYLPKSHDKIFPRQALINGRRNLVQLSTLCAFVLLTHLFTSNLPAFRAKETASENHGAGWERRMRKGRRSWLFVGYATVVSTTAVAFHVLCDSVNFQIWKDLSYFDVAFISAFYQFSVYVMIRLSHGGFTLGEVGLIGVGSTVLVMEAINLTIAKIWPVTTPYIKTVRYPNPLLIYQLALVSGSLLIGFLLSPLLVLSRHTSKVPAHRLKRPHDRRLKHPTEREVQRRALAVSFYFFAILIIVGLIGFWAQWCLGGRNPWVWAIVWLTEGSNTWSRPALLAYWALLGFFSVGAWSRQLARSKKFQTSNMALHGVSVTSDPSFTVDPPLSPSPSSNGFAHVATDLLDAADKRTPTLSLNARRKTFHALALFMFLPGIILDPAFTHFCLSAAFALFVFAEYIRYFALWPFGRFVHIFLNEFVDSKDSGSAILSHFYLLTGFANSLWLGGPWRILELTGALSLGIGDAMASIVGRRIGRTRWTEGNPKTIEGTVAFLITVLTTNVGLWLFGAIEPFSFWRYTTVLALGCLLEAVSTQNDNLTVPLFIWSMTVLFDVVSV